MAEEDLHVVLLPWSAFGHMIPFFQLSVALAKSGVRVSFVSTPRNIQRLPPVPPGLADRLRLVALPLPVLDTEQLPEGAEATVDVPFEKIQYLKVAYDRLKHSFEQLVVDQSPDWIIMDMITYWVADIAQERHIPLMCFSVFVAAMFVFLGNPEVLVGDGRKRIRPSPESLTSPPEWVAFPSSLAYKNFEADGVYAAIYEGNASGITDADRVAIILRSCRAVAVRSCYEYEGEYLNLLEKITGRPVIPVGLLPEEKLLGDTEINHGGSWGEIFGWLDEQKAKSVVFVGFGSECKLSKEQVYEIANGLELSGLPFLWALRKPSWATDDLDYLPEGFRERTDGRGAVSIGWAPQKQILAHPSIGGSLFHSGWGSVIETLQFGHCLVLLPLIIDQPLNARMLVDKGMAVEVERRDDGSFTGDAIANALRLAMVAEEGEKLRKKAREAAAVFGDEKLHQDHYFARLVDYLKSEVAKQQ